MKELTPQQIQENWEKLRSLINETFAGERLDDLNKMYDYFEERMMLAPASGKEHFHNAHPGGYVEHVLHTIIHQLRFEFFFLIIIILIVYNGYQKYVN